MLLHADTFMKTEVLVGWRSLWLRGRTLRAGVGAEYRFGGTGASEAADGFHPVAVLGLGYAF